ncbi:MAG: hypothetical protein A3G40_14260 [Deltaproteobacteria bacterium RIFCSPLOWO2_12_FULL_57_22]|nr:MAG: hypothetical protein A3G40_14260 [Deltaproteobacteria bacterium RIFCSPLOWO2_12_FULL_57_22]
MILGLDIDGVVADFLSPFLQVVARKTGMGAIAAETITDFNFKEHPFLTEAIVWKSMEEVSYDPAFWRGLSSLISDEDWHRLEALSGQGKLVFVTHRYERETYSIPQVSCDWLRRHGISRPVVYFTQEPKGQLVQDLGVSLFVDDRFENCQNVAEKTGAIVLMPHRTYNQEFTHPRVRRIQNFNELFTYVDES